MAEIDDKQVDSTLKGAGLTRKDVSDSSGNQIQILTSLLDENNKNSANLALSIGEGGRPNENKVLTVISGGKDFRETMTGQRFGGEFFPKNFFVPYEAESVKFGSSATYGTPLASVVEKAKNHPIGKAASAFQKAATGINATATALSKTPEKPKVGSPNIKFNTIIGKIPSWDSPQQQSLDSMSFKFRFGMYGEYSGRTEVLNPAVALALINVPSIISGTRLTGPIPSTPWVMGYFVGALADQIFEVTKATYQNPSLSASAVEARINSFLGNMEQKLFGMVAGWPGAVRVKMGNAWQTSLFTVEKTELTLSREVDTEGFPIWAEVNWSGIKTFENVHRAMPIYRMYKASTNRNDAMASFHISGSSKRE